MLFKQFLKTFFYMIMDWNPFLYRSKYKIFNHKIEIHKNDKDIWPSYPHVHFLNDDAKLNIYTGEIYRIQTKKSINKASDEDMKKLWNDRKFLEIVMEARKNRPINVEKLEKIPFKWIDNEKRKWIEKYDSNSK